MGWIFLICLELELFAKTKKKPGFYTLTDTRFMNNPKSKQNKKDSEHPLVLVSWKWVQKFSKKY